MIFTNGYMGRLQFRIPEFWGRLSDVLWDVTEDDAYASIEARVADVAEGRIWDRIFGSTNMPPRRVAEEGDR